jgi:hypothetical protein
MGAVRSAGPRAFSPRPFRGTSSAAYGKEACVTLPANDPFDVRDFRTNWPMAAERCELVDGAIVWWGSFNEEDKLRAERAFPEHQITLDGIGNIWLEHRKKPARDEIERELRSDLRRGAYALR